MGTPQDPLAEQYARLEAGGLQLLEPPRWVSAIGSKIALGRVEDWRRCSVGPAYPLLPRPLGVLSTENTNRLGSMHRLR